MTAYWGKDMDSVFWRAVLMGTGAVAVVAAACLVWVEASSPTAQETAAVEAAAAGGHTGARAPVAGSSQQRYVEVFVSGAVLHPGVYRLPAGLRVSDALAAAGGLLPDADPDRLPNLVGRLSDGKQIKVPRRGSRSSGTAKVDINIASLAELRAVPDMDPSVAQEIVDFRERYGPFTTISELHTLLGLDSTYVAVLRKFLMVAN
jgi:competence protein ComEA